MQRTLPAVGLVIVVLIVMITVLQETRVIGTDSNGRTASSVSSRESSLPETSAVTVDSHFCKTPASITAADTQLPFTDVTHGLTMTLPYAARWTDVDGGKLAPYLQLRNGIAFGPIVYGSLDMGKTCSAIRMYTLTFGPVRPAQLTKDAVLASYGNGTSSDDTVHMTTIGSLPAVEWGIGQWVCPAPMIELTGKTSNYILGMSCAALTSDDQENLRQLTKIAGTITAQ